jgi:hypothetical protein
MAMWKSLPAKDSMLVIIAQRFGAAIAAVSGTSARRMGGLSISHIHR